jgi:hypothetical protein
VRQGIGDQLVVRLAADDDPTIAANDLGHLAPWRLS